MEYREQGDQCITSIYPITDILLKTTTRANQHIEILQNQTFGKMLFIDGEGQSAELDEFIYHEALVHPAMIHSPSMNPTVLIIGGGEGATLREVLKYPTLTHVDMVDIDIELIEFFKQNCPTWHQNSFNHPKATLHIADINLWFANNPTRTYDVILCDLPDSFILNPDFLNKLRDHLNPNGVLNIQAGYFRLQDKHSLQELQSHFQQQFPNPKLYKTFVPFFQSEWAFLLHAPNPNPMLALPQNQIRSFNRQTIHDLFKLPAYMQ